MIEHQHEAARLQTSSYRSTTRKSVVDHGKSKIYRVSARKHSNKSPNKTKTADTRRNRFQSSFRKALTARSRFLGRDLTRQEWISLKNAVKRQNQVQFDSLTVQVRQLASEVSILRRCNPTSLLEVDDSISLLRNQVSLFRRQVFDLSLEHEQLSETCPHFKSRTMYYPHVTGRSISTIIPGFGPLNYDQSFAVTQLCCDSCLAKRQDAFFEWYGYDLSSFKSFSQFESLVSMVTKRDTDTLAFTKQLSTVAPLSLQPVWTEIISRKFRTL
jgi:hypothetical protein